MTERRLLRDGDPVEGLWDAEVTRTINPFGDEAVVWLTDYQGDRAEQFPRGTRVTIQRRPFGGDTWSDEFQGYVSERPTSGQEQGGETVELSIYTFDQFLRRRTNDTDLAGLSIFDALEAMITNEVPAVSWNSNRVSVANNVTLDRSYLDTRVEDVIRDLRQKSGNEQFGVDPDTFDFFFRPPETGNAPIAVTDVNAIDWDIPERGSGTPNEVVVVYNDGNDAVLVDDSKDKLDLKDRLDAPGAVSFDQRVQYPDVSSIQDARDIGERILEERSSTLTGTVTTFSESGVDPGQTVDVTVTARGLDGEFRVVSVTDRHQSGEMDIEVVEKRGNLDDVLARLQSTVERVELQGTAPDLVRDRVTDTRVDLLIDGDRAGMDVITTRSTATTDTDLAAARGLKQGESDFNVSITGSSEEESAEFDVTITGSSENTN